MNEEPLDTLEPLDPEEALPVDEEEETDALPEPVTPPPLPEPDITPPPLPKAGVVTQPPVPEAIGSEEPETLVVTPASYDEEVEIEADEMPSPFDAVDEPDAMSPEPVTTEAVTPSVITSATTAPPQAQGPKEKNNTGLIIGIVVAVLLLLCCCCIIAALAFSVIPMDGGTRRWGMMLAGMVLPLLS